MSKEGILSILSKKIERSDFTLRPLSLVIRYSIFQSFFFDQIGRFLGRRLGVIPTPSLSDNMVLEKTD